MSTHEPSPATRDTIAGVTSIAGACLGVVAMALHPTGREIQESGPSGAVVWRNAVVHGVAVAALALQTLGAFAVARRARAATLGLAECAFVAQCLALLGAVVAAMCSGFVMPPLILAHAGDAGARGAIEAVRHTNQAFAGLFALAGGAAIVAFSVIGRRVRLHRAVSVFGVVAGVGAGLMIVTGHLRLSVHGMGAVVLAHALWWIGAGIALLRRG